MPWRNEWVFILDADERITPELADEIRATLAAPDKADGKLAATSRGAAAGRGVQGPRRVDQGFLTAGAGLRMRCSDRGDWKDRRLSVPSLDVLAA